MRRRALTRLLLVLPFHGCAIESHIFGDEYSHAPEVRHATCDYSAYFGSFDNPWMGGSRHLWPQTPSPPDAIHEARREVTDYWKEGIPATVYVYREAKDASGHCIDAYVMAEPTSTVIK